MDIYTAIRISALHSVTAPDWEYMMRKVFRWYSKTFHTPIDRVEEMPLEDLMQDYYEEHYEAMDEERQEAERDKLLMSPEDQLKQVMAEEAEEAEMWEMGRILALEEARKKKAAVKKAQGKKLDTKDEQQITAPRHPVPGLLRDALAGRPSPESDLPSVPAGVPPGGITMSFVDEAALAKEIAEFEAMADGRDRPRAKKP